MDKKLKVWELSLLISLCLSLCVGTWAQAQQSEISGGLIRLHVIAVSDDAEEQAIKLRVRDRVLEYLAPKLENAKDSEGAQKVIERELDGIARAAQSAAQGRKVSVTLSDEQYPTRDYGSFILPAGTYCSLRVILGEGEGHNWWCVVFPPLCISAAEQRRALDAMSDETQGIITEADGYEVRLRILELWGELMNRINR